MGCDDAKVRCGHKSGSALYCLGVLGAAVYLVKTSTGFWAGVLGILKAFFWPALLVYKVMELLKV